MECAADGAAGFDWACVTEQAPATKQQTVAIVCAHRIISSRLIRWLFVNADMCLVYRVSLGQAAETPVSFSGDLPFIIDGNVKVLKDLRSRYSANMTLVRESKAQKSGQTKMALK